MTRTCSTDRCSRELSRRNKSGLCRPCLARKNLCTPERQAKAVAGLKRHLADPVARQQHAERSRARLAAWRATPAGAERQREMACENLRRGNAPEYRERRVRGIRAAAYPGIPEDRWDECMQLAKSMPAEEAKRIIRDDVAAKERARHAAMTPFERQLEAVRTGRARIIDKPDLRPSGPAYSLVGNATGML